MAIDYNKRRSAPGRGVISTAPAAPVSLSKVTLTKVAPSVSLTKSGASGGLLRVNLNWNARPAVRKGDTYSKRAVIGGPIDLDLGCLYEFSDGTKGVVQALGNSFRDHNQYTPDAICWLDGDDRSGANGGGENLFVNLAAITAIKRILVFAYIYEGTANWGAADGVVTLFPASGPQIEVRLDDHDPRSQMCGIALLENVGGHLSVRREVRYVKGHRELDRAYGWGMRWTNASK